MSISMHCEGAAPPCRVDQPGAAPPVRGRAPRHGRRARWSGRADPIGIRTEDIEAAIEALTSSYRNPNESIRFSIDDGRVFLWGEVDWHYQKMEIEMAVRRVRGVCDLRSDLTILGLRSREGDDGSRRLSGNSSSGL